MANFPTLSSGQVAKHPATRIRSASTKVLSFADDTEQRWKQRAPLARFTLTYRRLKQADMITLRNFFDSMKGEYDSTFSITLDGTTYNNCAFDQDEFTYVEKSEKLYDVTLKIRQTQK